MVKILDGFYAGVAYSEEVKYKSKLINLCMRELGNVVSQRPFGSFCFNGLHGLILMIVSMGRSRFRLEVGAVGYNERCAEINDGRDSLARHSLLISYLVFPINAKNRGRMGPCRVERVVHILSHQDIGSPGSTISTPVKDIKSHAPCQRASVSCMRSRKEILHPLFEKST